MRAVMMLSSFGKAFETYRRCFMGGTCDVREEPREQNTRNCWAQELARSSALENARQKKASLPNAVRIGGQTGGTKIARTTRNARPRWEIGRASCRERV